MEHTPTFSNSPRTQERIASQVQAFREIISKADGTLQLLRKTTADSKKLYIASRLVRTSADGDDPNVDKRFWGWNDKRMPMSSVMLVDVYTQDDNADVRPLGHMDWSIRGEVANGSGNMHEAVIPKQVHEQLAREMWTTGTAFKIDPEYQKQNIGTLMLATSGVILTTIGAKKFFPGVLLEPAENTFKRFDLREEDFFTNTGMQPLPIEKISEHPQINKVIAEFV